MKKTIGFFGVAMLVASPVFAQQDPAQQHGSMSQAEESVAKNLANNPQSKGLPKALGHLIDNSVKHEGNGGGRAIERAERTDRADRAERADRPERPERAERPERPERPEKVVRVDRPDLPGKGRNR
jgi:hypothetical protein